MTTHREKAFRGDVSTARWL